MRFKEGIRDVEALRVLQIRPNSTGDYDWIKVIHLHVFLIHIRVVTIARNVHVLQYNNMHQRQFPN